MTEQHQLWNFLVSKNKHLEYRTVVAPDFLCDFKGTKITGLLARAAGGDVTKPGQAIYTQILNSELGDLTLVFWVIESSYQDVGIEGDGLIKDAFGREIRLIEGFVFKGNLPLADINLGQDNFNKLHEDIKEHYRNFWKWEKPESCFSSRSYAFEVSEDPLILISRSPYVVKVVKTEIKLTNTEKFKSEIVSVIFCLNNKSLIVRDKNKNQTVWIYDVSGKTKIELFRGLEINPYFCHFTPVVISPDGQYVATAIIGKNSYGDISQIIIGSIQNNRDIKIIDGHGPFLLDRKRVNALAFIDNNILISDDSNKKIFFWNDKVDNYPGLSGHSGEIRVIVYNYKLGNIFASADNQGTIIIWELSDNKKWAEIKRIINNAHGTPNGCPINSLTFSPDGRTLASAGDDGKIQLWDSMTGQKKNTLEKVSQDNSTPHINTVNTVAFHPNGKLLASGDNEGRIEVWDIFTQKSIASSREHDKDVTSLCFSPDGKILASGSKDKTIMLWELT
jgi:WD40 repeat protein